MIYLKTTAEFLVFCINLYQGRMHQTCILGSNILTLTRKVIWMLNRCSLLFPANSWTSPPRNHCVVYRALPITDGTWTRASKTGWGGGWAGITMAIGRVFLDLKKQRDMMVCTDCPMKTKSLHTSQPTLKKWEAWFRCWGNHQALPLEYFLKSITTWVIVD